VIAGTSIEIAKSPELKKIASSFADSVKTVIIDQ
jgi:hypothetical protein